MSDDPTLHFLCGKMAAGKSTLAKRLSRERKAVVLVEDQLLATLFPSEKRDIADYVKCSHRIKEAVEGLVCNILSYGVSVVLDFPGNTLNQRKWFHRLIEKSNSAHELHFLDASDELCKRQLRERSRDLPDGAPFTTDRDFEAVTAYFQAPSDSEGFNLVLHCRT